jgi:hypothetical protein
MFLGPKAALRRSAMSMRRGQHTHEVPEGLAGNGSGKRISGVARPAQHGLLIRIIL